jgi:hypothetical protein
VRTLTVREEDGTLTVWKKRRECRSRGRGGVPEVTKGKADGCEEEMGHLL